MPDMIKKVNIIGAGLSGLSAAYTLAKQGIPSRLISAQVSERAQSNLAEGGINAVLDVMGEGDTKEEHFLDTMRGGCDLSDPDMVKGLVDDAPKIIDLLLKLGVPFNRENGKLVERNFGGQKKKRTAFVKSQTGKMLTTSFINAVRKYESKGLIERYQNHLFEELVKDEKGGCAGVWIYDIYKKNRSFFEGPVIACFGGLNGFFYGNTTGTTANTGSAAAALFASGVSFGNLEFIQYHPTTAAISEKRLLISEAARSEGGRLFYKTDSEEGELIYFMEEKYGEIGNLMPRDVISREIALLPKDAEVYLDLTGIPETIWERRLIDLREEIMDYLNIDPKNSPVPVSPGIHYFMGGILVDREHRTNIKNLYAAGECAAAYHGANRLGGNSLLGAIRGGMTAADTVISEIKKESEKNNEIKPEEDKRKEGIQASFLRPEEKELNLRISEILFSGMSIIRDEEGLKAAIKEIDKLLNPVRGDDKSSYSCSKELRNRLLLSKAMLLSAMERRESRGAHYRSDHNKTLPEFKKVTVAELKEDEIIISFKDIGGNYA